MRNRMRRLQNLWFCEFTEEIPEGSIDTIRVYSKPRKLRLGVSATSGYTLGWGAGIVTAYDRFITSYAGTLGLKEGMMVYVDRIPELDLNGELKTEEVNGVVQPTVLPDYMLDKVYYSQKGTVTRFGIKKV